ncbi:hypothetical protein N8T08_004625 [Aspergillus melleus]|uniref:Uncharacterized protein n=1 Tax=Aspergillus melleus TaxID=138277 RepID=A0ACC3B434_9EURO|nr:hypothetical protein N8T08_004625 [Aspergillus melleus]
MPSPLSVGTSSKMQMTVNSLLWKQTQAIHARPNTPTDPQKPSPCIVDLAKSPEEFLKHNSIESGMIFAGAKTNGRLPRYAKLIDISTDHDDGKHYNVMFHEKSSRYAIPAAFLCANADGQNPRSPAYIDILISNPTEKFLFTPELNGSSIIVTKKDDLTYRVFHDSRICSSVLYDNVVLAIDYCEYGDEYDKDARCRKDLATACLHYESPKTDGERGHWAVYCQYLQEAGSCQRSLRFNGCESPVQKMKSYQAPQVARIRDEFNRFVRAEGEAALNQPLPFIQDGTFEVITDTDAMLTNPAVASTERLRLYLKPYGDMLKSSIKDAKANESLVGNVDVKILLEDKVQRLEKDLRHYDYLIRTSERLDYTYLWLRQKQIVNPLEAPRISLPMLTI